MLPLFKEYPLLADRLPHVALGEFPTPVQELDRLGSETSIARLYVKRDDLSGKLYGGNKPRKLEFTLGDALRSGAKEVLTFGGAGSNHALATAIYARQAGLRSISMLAPQPNARYVRDNLLMSHKCGAELHSCGGETPSPGSIVLGFLATIYQLVRHRVKSGRFPYVIPMGGSSLLGITGFVNAAFELREQMAAGEMAAPECIYVACGTMGTTAGLVLGLRAAGLDSRVVSVRVTSEDTANRAAMLKLIKKVNSFLHSQDPSFPVFRFSATDLDLRHDYYGKQYALFTPEGMEAAALMRDCEDIELDGTYTGKAFAALLGDARAGRLEGRTVLFWNTRNSRSLTEAIAGLDYRDLPRHFHRYFEEEVQPLDRDPGR